MAEGDQVDSKDIVLDVVDEFDGQDVETEEAKKILLKSDLSDFLN